MDVMQGKICAFVLLAVHTMGAQPPDSCTFSETSSKDAKCLANDHVLLQGKVLEFSKKARPRKDHVLLQGKVLEVSKGSLARGDSSCHTALPGEPCHDQVTWAMKSGITSNPEWYPDLTGSSSFEEFQAHLYERGHSDCPEPCPIGGCSAGSVQRRRRAAAMCSCRRRHGRADLASGWACMGDTISKTSLPSPAPDEDEPSTTVEAPSPSPEQAAPASCDQSQVRRRRRASSMCSCRRRSTPDRLFGETWTCQGDTMVPYTAPPAPPPQPAPALPGWHPTSETVGNGQWCRVGVPPSTWELRECNAAGPRTRIKVLTYNLFWWNLFGRRGGGGASKLIAESGRGEAYDLMGFQECEDTWRVLRDAGLSDKYGVVSKGKAVSIAYRRSRWSVLEHGLWDVAEDRPEQWYGRRGAQYARLKHRNGRIVTFINHHGPLPVGTGGKCGGRATAYNILKTVASKAHTGDQIIMVGDFNANRESSTIQELDQKIHRVFTGTAIGGIDHIYSNCGDAEHVITADNLGSGGSDHDALSAVIEA